MKQKKSSKSVFSKKKNIFKEKTVVHIDLGCGENKRPGCIGVDFRDAQGVDLVQNLSLFPWKAIPDNAADVIYSSHLLEHINPDSANPQLAGLIDLLLAKSLVTKTEIEASVGEYRFLGGFIRFMDEVWRITKPGGQFISTLPFAGSPGYWQDLTHVNPLSHVSFAYLDPYSKVEGTNQYYGLYQIYRPMPWKIVRLFYDQNGFIEVCLEKRRIDKSYNVSSDNGMKTLKKVV